MKKLACLFTLLFAANASATVLTFDGNGTLSNQYASYYTGIGDTYTQDGYTLTVGAGDHFDRMNGYGLSFHDRGLNTEDDNWAYLTFSGGLFDLTGFDFTLGSGNIKTNLSPSTTWFASGSHSVNLTGLTWVAFSSINSGYLYLDNVRVQASNVPEPPALALLGLGLLGLGYRTRKSRT